jgi:GNAT superfamily N-acetyltransferase
MFDFEYTTELSQDQLEAIYGLWRSEYPVKIHHENIDGLVEFLADKPNQEHTFAISEGKIIAWFFVFERFEARWFAMIINGQFHGKGLGSQLLSMGKERTDELWGWVSDFEGDVKADGSAYRVPVRFYEKNGFTILEERLEVVDFSGRKMVWKK